MFLPLHICQYEYLYEEGIYDNVRKRKKDYEKIQ